MSKRIQLRRGTTTEHNSFTGAVGEVTVDTTNKTLRVHDGVTVGGTPLAKISDIPNATEAVAGKAKIATTAIAQAGTNNSDIITPLKLKDTVFGLGQTRKVVTKISGTTYTNTTGKPIGFEVIFKHSGTTGTATASSNITVNSEIRQTFATYGGDTSYRWSMFVIILPNESYSFNAVTLSSIEKVTEIS